LQDSILARGDHGSESLAPKFDYFSASPGRRNRYSIRVELSRRKTNEPNYRRSDSKKLAHRLKTLVLTIEEGKTVDRHNATA
jgi:hypothetical protein